MKVTVICDVLGRPNNGTTLAALNFISYMKEKGHEVTVVSPDRSTEGKEGYFVVPTVNLGKFLNGVVEKNGVSLAKADKKILRAAIAGADAVHLLIPFPLSWKALRIARKNGIPVTASFHCQAENFTAHLGLMNARLANRAVYRLFYRKVYRKVDCVHYPTAFIKDVFEKSVHKEVPCRVISNGVNSRFFEEVPRERISDKFTILCTGRFSPEKSQHTLIRALKNNPHRENIKVIFAGDGPKKEKLERLAEKCGVDAEFRFFSREELVKILHAADLYVHTAVIEIEAIACVEAIVSGLVPVICDAGRSATKYFALDERNLYREGDPADLSEKISWFIEHPEQIEAYRARYAGMRGDFDQEECMRQMEKMILDAAGKKES